MNSMRNSKVTPSGKSGSLQRNEESEIMVNTQVTTTDF